MDRLGNVTVKKDHDPGLWNLDYLITCFAEKKICVSFGLWLLSCLFWFTSFSLHFFLRCKRKARYEESVFWSIYGFFGSMCNTIGALLSKQLTIQIITGAYMALSDIINFVLTLFPACNSRNRVGLRHRSSRRRHKRHFLSALSLVLFIRLGYCYSLEENYFPAPELHSTGRRRLLGTMLQENTDVVGFTLGIVAVLVSWTVRVPIITRLCKGLTFPVIRVWAVLFSALASLMYAAAIISHDRSQEYFVRAIPWFLISLGAAALDVALLLLSCIMKNKRIQQLGLVFNATMDEESCKLLETEEHVADKRSVVHLTTTNAQDSSWSPLKAAPNRCLSSNVSLGRYMRLSVEQVQQNDIGAVRLPGDGQTNPGLIYHKEAPQYLDLNVYPPPSVRHSTNSPSSSSDASYTTDLEWDFEDLDQNWNTDCASIQPNDSSVLKSININPEQQFPSTMKPNFKSLESTAIHENVQSADLPKIEQK
ncbi:transmembrane protein 44 isoform X1 [Engystomops pustulosus]|uniref:transmembrane protein 44 isoform X1 n=2 Tax=Engystomops pustulosus TaxID=76066 RepID=UPI003AFA27B3